MEKGNKKKTYLNIFLFLIIAFLTFYILFKDKSISDILFFLPKINKKFIAIAIGCMGLYLLFESINIGRTLKVLGEKSSFLRNIKYALIGFFFSSVTPAASRGSTNAGLLYA